MINSFICISKYSFLTFIRREKTFKIISPHKKVGLDKTKLRMTTSISCDALLNCKKDIKIIKS